MGLRRSCAEEERTETEERREDEAMEEMGEEEEEREREVSEREGAKKGKVEGEERAGFLNRKTNL